jgi:hypothetical protein
MHSLEKYLPFVNDQAAYHEKQVAIFAANGNQFKKGKHEHSAQQYRALAAAMLETIAEETSLLPRSLPNPTDSIPQLIPTALLRPKQLRLSLGPDDIRGLPQDLLDELSVSGDIVEFTIMEIIREMGGVASLDQLLVGLFRRTQEIHKRQNLTTRLYRMGQKNMVYNVPGKKGVYSLEQLTEEQAGALLERTTLEPNP